MPAKKIMPDTVYSLGAFGNKKEVSKRELAAMKIYLTYDFGYSVNDALEKQNIFSDGFFFSVMDSAFGKGLVDKYFPLLKGDFEKRMACNRRSEMYRHPAGKLNIEDELKVYAADFYTQYQRVKESKREIDASLLKDCISLCGMHRYFRPRDVKLLAKVFIRDRKMEVDPTFEKRNFALFGARSNADVFGEAFMELAAQAVLAGASFAQDNGYHTTTEEAYGVISRRALDVIGSKFPDVIEKKKLNEIKEHFRSALGLSKEDLVQAARAVMTFQKMIKDVDTSVLIDNFIAKKMYQNQVDQLLVKVVKDSNVCSVTGAMDALELHCYLESIGKVESFLSVPEKVYEQEELFKRNPDLLIKNYQVKMASVSKKQVGNTLSLKKVWDFQASDKGWGKIASKFSLEKDLDQAQRFALLRRMSKKESKQVEKYSRALLLEDSLTLIQDLLHKQDLKKISVSFNKLATGNDNNNEFDTGALAEILNTMEEGKELACYTQNGEMFYRIILLSKEGKEEFPTFAQAKKNGYLTSLVEKKLIALNRGNRIDDEYKERLVHALLKKEGGKEAEKIIAAEQEGKFYTRHKEERIVKWREGKLKNAKDGLLAQFNINETQQVVARYGKNKEMARDAFYTMEPGTRSELCYLENGDPYYIHLIAKKMDQEKLSQVREALHRNLSLESRGALYEEILSYIVENKMLVMTRLKKGA
ncbi:MAG: hypothetical protein SP4CHLAM5_08670 [Chlamydiia bacterium]|nr:hypothetical protein [Chlamydiia bacterium]MCH9624530.1 hypothetical protein [Chlamydiia bacterium]